MVQAAPLGMAFLLGLTLAVVGQAQSPFHIPTHELTQLVAALIWFGGAALASRGDPLVHPWVRFVRHLGWGIAALVGLWTGLSVFNQLLHGCRMEGAVAFLFVTDVPVLALAAAVGGMLAGTRVRTRVGVLVGVALLCALHDLLQAAYGFRVVDPVLGDPLAFDQRANMTVPVLHVWSRVWLSLMALGVLGLDLARFDRAFRPLAGILVVLAGLFHLAGGHGVGFDRSLQRSVLDGEVRSAHFVFRFDRRGPVPARLPAIIQEAEFQYGRLFAWLGVEQGPVVEVRVYNGPAELHRVTGINNAHAAPYRMEINWWDAFDDTFPHELVHTVHAELSWHPWLLIAPGQVEGLAMAWDQGYGTHPHTHAEVAAAHRAGHLPSAEQVMHPLGFHRIHEGNAYRFAGSFLGFLILEHGMQSFRAYQGSLNAEAVYGRTLGQLDADWRVFLEGVEVDGQTQALARDRFDPALATGVYDQVCPKLGSSDPSPEHLARLAFQGQDFAEASSRYQQLWEQTAQARWLWAFVDALQGQQDFAAADEALKQLPAGPPDQELRRLNEQIHNHLGLGDWAALLADFEARRAFEAAPPDRVELERLLAEPGVAPRLAPLLLAGRDREDYVRIGLSALAEEIPGDWDLLLASRVPWLPDRRGTLDADREAQWAMGLDEVERAGLCDDDGRRLAVALDHFVDVGACELADRAASALAKHCRSAHSKRLREIGLARLDFSRVPSGTCGGEAR